MPTTDRTPGQTFTDELRTMFSIGPRTRWHSKRNSRIVRMRQPAIVEDVCGAVGEYRGIESDERTANLDAGFAALCAWRKHVDGFRIDGVFRKFLTEDMSPWQWTAYLGRMIDSGCTNSGEFEVWLAAEARTLRATR